MGGRQAFFQKLSSSLIIPIVIIPIAAILLAAGDQAGIAPLKAAGLALIKFWLPLFFAAGLAHGFSNGDGMAVISVTAGYLVLAATAEVVSGDPQLTVGVLGGVMAGGILTPVYLRVRNWRLPPYLALFDGPRMGPAAAAVVGYLLGIAVGHLWPPFLEQLVRLGHWIYSAGGLGAFVYGGVLRLLIPTGLHHILTQLVDTQLGSFTDPATQKLIMGEYLRFLAGDPTAGRLHAGLFTLCFTVPAAGLAIAHEALPSERKRVLSMMWTGTLTAVVLGVTEPIEFAFIFASPLLFGIHAVLQGLASYVMYELGIRHAGYALSMYLINYRLSEKGWLIIPVGLAFAALYYVLFRAVIRWRKPLVLGQTVEAEGAPPAEAPHVAGSVAADGRPSEGAAFVSALGGKENLLSVDACMTRLRLVVRSPAQVQKERLLKLGAAGIVMLGGGAVQVVVGARAGDLAARIRRCMEAGRADSSPVQQEQRAAVASRVSTITILSPVTGEIVPLSEVDDEVFSRKLAGDGVAVRATEGRLVAPATGRVAHIFPGGHALGVETPEGMELLVHVGIGTVALKGEGFSLVAEEGEQVQGAQPLGQFDLAVLRQWGKSAVTPVLVTNAGDFRSIEVIASGLVRAGEPLLRVTVKDR